MERLYVLDLYDIRKKPVTKRLRVAAKNIRIMAAKYVKTPLKNIKISSSVNKLLFSQGSAKIPSKLKVKIIVDEKGAVVSLPEEPKATPEKKEEKKVKPILEEKKEEKPEEKEEKQEKPKFEQKIVEAASKK